MAECSVLYFAASRTGILPLSLPYTDTEMFAGSWEGFAR